MKQLTLAATRGFEKHSRATRKAEFLAPRGKPDAVGRVLRLDRAALPEGVATDGRRWSGTDAAHVLHRPTWFNLSDLACEEALYDVSRIPGVSAGSIWVESAFPMPATLMNFRLLLEIHHLDAALFARLANC